MDAWVCARATGAIAGETAIANASSADSARRGRIDAPGGAEGGKGAGCTLL